MSHTVANPLQAARRAMLRKALAAAHLKRISARTALKRIERLRRWAIRSFEGAWHTFTAQGGFLRVDCFTTLGKVSYDFVLGTPLAALKQFAMSYEDDFGFLLGVQVTRNDGTVLRPNAKQRRGVRVGPVATVVGPLKDSKGGKP